MCIHIRTLLLIALALSRIYLQNRRPCMYVKDIVRENEEIFKKRMNSLPRNGNPSKIFPEDSQILLRTRGFCKSISIMINEFVCRRV